MEGPFRYRLVSCAVFQRELSIALGRTRHLVDPEFLEIGLHERPEKLRAAIQRRIDEISSPPGPPARPYDAILLGYGLCGNGLSGIEARGIPLVIPRAHDCCTILLGSRAEFAARFGDSRSASWSSAGYLERGRAGFREAEGGRSEGMEKSYATLIEEYGEENAAYIWESLHPDIDEGVLRFVELEETAHLGHADALRERAAREGKEFLLLRGSAKLLGALVAGDWNPADFLLVPPGARIEATWEDEVIFEARSPG
ncbi:MAG TPA: DUF1638 domain-containing protein [Rectinemataceae bacterium]|nr:DUF1638 domain-containing protein [Rectinemataceae bacterium]